MNRFAAAALAAFLCLTPAAADAFGLQCFSAERMSKIIEGRFSERPIFEGINAGALVTFYLSDAGTFSIVLKSAQGLACIAAAGTDGHFLPPAPRRRRHPVEREG